MFLSSNSIASTFISTCDGLSALPTGMVNALVALKNNPSSVINLVFATKFNSSCVVLYIVIVHSDGFWICLILLALIVNS